MRIEILRMTEWSLGEDESLAFQGFDDWISAGYSPSHIAEDVLAGAARELGQRWVDDCCAFAEVTSSMSLLHRILHYALPAMTEELGGRETTGSILVSPLSGDQHIFGTSMVCTFFQAAGWQVCSGFETSAADIVGQVQEEYFDVVALTLNTPAQISTFKRLAEGLRRVSANRDLKIIAGGQVFSHKPELTHELGLDSQADSASEALDAADAFIAGKRRNPC